LDNIWHTKRDGADLHAPRKKTKTQRKVKLMIEAQNAGGFMMSSQPPECIDEDDEDED
jgi:hypothetical protein